MENFHDLKFFADVYCKLKDVSYHVEDNYNYNLNSCARSSNDNFMQDRQNILKNISDIVYNPVELNISDLVEEHELWQSWGEENIYNDDQKQLLGVILGLIRFAPPKTYKKMSNNTGKERWAHSEGSLLNYCGLGNSNNPNRHLRDAILELTRSLVNTMDSPFLSSYASCVSQWQKAYMNTKGIEELSEEDCVVIENLIIKHLATDMVIKLFNTYQSLNS